MGSPFDRDGFVISGHRFVEDIPGVSEQAWLWAISILATLYSVLVLMIRGAIKWGCFGVCDWVLLGAYVVSFVIQISLWVALTLGLGKAAGLVDGRRYEIISDLVFTCRFFLYWTLSLSKISVLFFVKRMIPIDMRAQYWAIQTCVWIIGVLAFVSPAIITGACYPYKFLDGEPHAACKVIGLENRVIALQLIDLIQEVIITAVPIWICLSIKLNKKHRFMVILGFGFRLTLMPFCVLYTRSLITFLHSGHNNIGVIPNLIWQQVLISYSLILATTPCLRIFIRRFRTGGISGLAQQTSDRQRSLYVAGVGSSLKPMLGKTNTGFSNDLLSPTQSGPQMAQRSMSGISDPSGLSVRPVQPTNLISRNVNASDDELAWEKQMSRPGGWEKARAAQLMAAPRRMSIPELDFVTGGDLIATDEREVV
ncbi:hypothetical protein MBLNU457_3266t1 [Dothideomycetes sp. NU457]